MLLGRLELLSVFVMFSPRFWRSWIGGMAGLANKLGMASKASSGKKSPLSNMI
tara:strand:+ start:92 stop:250 length:159 start_codon:yes stop_codon:yes gene_type:complete